MIRDWAGKSSDYERNVPNRLSLWIFFLQDILVTPLLSHFIILIFGI